MKGVLPLFVVILLLVNQNNYAQQVGNPAPDFEVSLVDGGTFKLSEQMGKVVFLFLFGNTCPSCIAAGPSIESNIHQQYIGDPNYVAVGLDIWDGSSAAVNGFRNQTGITFPLAKNSSFVASDYSTTYDRLMVIDANGILAHKGVIGAGSDINNTRQAIASSLEAIVADPCETAEINITPVLTDPTCTGEMNGSIDLTITGTYPGFSVLWSNGSMEEDIAGLGAGAISVTVTDSEGCTSVEDYNLGEPPPLNALIDITDNTCYGGSDGKIAVEIEGGTPPYITLYQGNEFTDALDNLDAGTYEFLVTDAHQCELTFTATVNQPAQLLVEAINGSEEVEAFQTYSYTILNPTGLPWMNTDFEWQLQGGSIVGGSGSATINVQWGSGDSGWVEAFVRDLSGCTSNTIRKTVQISDTVMIPDSCEMAGISINENLTHPSCAASEDGSIQVNVSGNYPGFTLHWSNGKEEPAISGLGKGSYIVTVTDSKGCTSSKEFMLTEPTALGISEVVYPPACSGDSGSIKIEVTGGTGPYSITWSTGATSDSIAGTPEGCYTVEITDAAGCSEIREICVNATDEIPLLEITGPELPEALQTYAYTVPAIMDASYLWNVTGGTILSGQGTPEVELIWESVESGSIEVTAETLAGCMSNTATLDLSISMVTSLEQTDHPVFRIYPNPAGKVLIISSRVPFEITIYSLQGSKLLVSMEQQIDLGGLARGTYLVAFRSGEVSKTVRLVKQ